MAVKVKLTNGDIEEFDGDIEVCIHNDGWLELWDDENCLFIVPEHNVEWIRENA